MGKPYANLLHRIRKINTDCEKLIAYNQELSEANRKLREARATEAAHYAANIRVIRKEIEEQVREENLRSA